jgi:hypothetical protein
VDDDVVFDLASDNMSEDGDLIIRAFAQHPITQTLVDYKEVAEDRPRAASGRCRGARRAPG